MSFILKTANMNHNENHIQTPCLQKHRLILKTKWEKLSTEERVPYDKQARDHLARQGVISESVADAMRKDKGGSCSRSFLSVQQATGIGVGRTQSSIGSRVNLIFVCIQNVSDQD